MITLEVKGDEYLVKAFKKFVDPSERRDLLDQVGSYGVSSTQQRFLDERGPDGQPWKKSRRARERGGQTLRDKGLLFSSLAHNTNPSSVEWGSNRIDAGIHQLGGTIRPKTAKKLAFKGVNGMVFADKVTIPARPYLGINAEDVAEINATAQDWMKGMLQ